MKEHADRRGFEIREFPGSFRIATVRADIDDTSLALTNLIDGERVVDIGPAIPDEQGIGIFQFVGQSCTGLIPQMLRPESALSNERLAALSKELNADVVCFQHEDTSGWSTFEAYRDGQIVEEYQWGPDYEDEFAEHMAEMGMDFDELDGQWDASILDDDELAAERFKFRSSLRTVDEKSLLNWSAFLDATYREFDLWQPSWEVLDDADSSVLIRADLVK